MNGGVVMRDPRYDCLFEPIKLGPVTAKNRFYQVPHCTGMGWRNPEMLAAMRGVKAQGGWGVVNTEYCSVHPTSDDGHYPYARLWDIDDIRDNALMTDAVHEHGALAGVELWFGGRSSANFYTREIPFSIQSGPESNISVFHPVQSRQLDKSDIALIHKWQGDAARRAVEAGFDIVYVYATHGYLISDFLDPDINNRTDEYGGSLENRYRIVRELIDVTRNAVGDKAAVAVRYAADLSDPESLDAFGPMAELPDFWDIVVHDYGVEMGASRFVPEAALQDSVRAAKSLTSKPVVAVGRFTSPDSMARVIRDGTQDMIGAARPSIADPFLPKKIEEGRVEDIRECIGCNMCYALDTLGAPIRCTQNPTMGEEYRRGWHPEKVSIAHRRDRVLVVGSGPAGLEAARVLGEQGHEVMLAEAKRDIGGRVTQECALPGLSEWARVRDWRLGQINKLDTIEIFRESLMTVADIQAVGVDHVVLATGARWGTDAIGRARSTPVDCAPGSKVISADIVLSGGTVPDGSVVIFDDDHYYMGPVLSLALRARGHEVTLITPAGRAGQWSYHSSELFSTNKGMLEAGVKIVTNRSLQRIASDHVVTSCIFTGQESDIAADWVIPLARRLPNDDLYQALLLAQASAQAGTPTHIVRIGDSLAPGTIAAAVYSGYKAAMERG